VRPLSSRHQANKPSRAGGSSVAVDTLPMHTTLDSVGDQESTSAWREIGSLSAALSGMALVNAATVVPDALLRSAHFPSEHSLMSLGTNRRFS
jgi:hypothetical protein